MIFSKITGIGKYLPKQVISNNELIEKTGIDSSHEWIFERTGITYRHLASKEETLAYMATEASKEAILQSYEKSSKKIGYIILAANTTVFNPLSRAGFPAISGEIQQMLLEHIVDKCGFCDLQSGCSGINHALYFGDSLIRSGYQEKVLVIGAERMQDLTDFSDRSTCILFGDGASAFILTSSAIPGFIGHRPYGDGSLREMIISQTEVKKTLEKRVSISPTIHMEGRQVHEEVIRFLREGILDFEQSETLNPISRNHRTKLLEIRKIIPHQANGRTIEAVAKSLSRKTRDLGSTYEEVLKKFPILISETANCSTATPGMVSHELIKEHELKEGDHILMSSFGAGFSAFFSHYII